jgi:hypothetical protein
MNNSSPAAKESVNLAAFLREYAQSLIRYTGQGHDSGLIEEAAALIEQQRLELAPVPEGFMTWKAAAEHWQTVAVNRSQSAADMAETFAKCCDALKIPHDREALIAACQPPREPRECPACLNTIGPCDTCGGTARETRAGLPDGLHEAAQLADWGQVAMNGGPPCFHLEGGKFCLRAWRWAGHNDSHTYIGLHELLQSLTRSTETIPDGVCAKCRHWIGYHGEFGCIATGCECMEHPSFESTARKTRDEIRAWECRNCGGIERLDVDRCVCGWTRAEGLKRWPPPPTTRGEARAVFTCENCGKQNDAGDDDWLRPGECAYCQHLTAPKATESR